MRTVLFVCAHGAYRSRVAASFFNASAPAGWHATSGGQDPQDAISAEAARAVAGTSAEAHLERDRPRPADLGSADRAISIDCDVPGAERWSLSEADAGPAQHAELRHRAERLAAELSGG